MSAVEVGLRADALVVGYPARRSMLRRSRAGTGDRVVLGPVTLVARPGTVTALVGPNGAGKSTLLRALTGVAKPLAGDVLVDGCSLRTLGHAERARRIASVSHERGAPGGLTSREAVALGRHPHTGWSGHLDVEDQRIVDEAIERVGAGPLADRLVDELSDGERQRVSIARALAQEASVLILDEPTAFLDVTGRVRTMQLAHDLARTASIAVVIATHDLELTLPVVDRIWAVRGGVLHDGTLADLAAAGRLSDVFDTPIHHDTSTDAVRITVPR